MTNPTSPVDDAKMAARPAISNMDDVSRTEGDVLDLGWNEPDDALDPIIVNLPNTELWKLLRRFNKQTYHVKSLPGTPRHFGLDMDIARDESFTPVKFKTHMERFYMTVVVGLFHFWKHLTRLRSWNESARTGAFLAGYTVAWLFDSLMTCTLWLLMILILFPSSRKVCFSPAPPSIINSSTGGVKKPMAGVMASGDSLTGAPEKHPGEAVEQEAHSFVNSIITLAVGLAGDRNPQDFDDIKYKTANVRAVEQDKTKKPVSDAVFQEAATVSHFISVFADYYERFGNALSPTTPFPKRKPQVMLASCLLPFALLFQFTSSRVLLKGVGFVIGLLIFGDPLWKQAFKLLDRKYPGWTMWADPKNTILRGVPTDIQLTITLLRLGEENHAPLPPAPDTQEPPQMKVPPDVDPALSERLGIDPLQVSSSMQPDPQKKEEAEGGPDTKMTKKHSRILVFVKGLLKGGVNAGLAADRAAAHMGIKGSKYRTGVVRKGPTPDSGPVKFGARLEGKSVLVSIIKGEDGASVGWCASEGGERESVIRVDDITEIQKIGGLGWKTKIAVAWATEDEVMDGILIRTGKGSETHFTAMPSRDELFNRLVALGPQTWKEY